MAITLQEKVTKEEKPNTCKTLITTTNSTSVPTNSCKSYFLSITIPQQKVKIKVPEVLVKAMQRKKKGSSTDVNADEMDKNRKKKKKMKRTNGYTTHVKNIKRVGSIFANVFRLKKSSASPQNQCSVTDNVVGTGGENNLQIVVSHSCSFKEILKIDDHHGNNKKKKKMQLIVKETPSLKPSVSLSSYISRKKKTTEKSCVKGKEKEDLCQINDNELCKKRILMGEKCKPLNASGVLHYDKNGVILPELV